MAHPAITPLGDDFQALWSGWYAGTPPIGFLLRAAHPERWLRIHSLPGSKRYATSASEYAELLQRHNTVAADVLGSDGARCAVLTYAACEGRGSLSPGALAVLGVGDLPLVSRLPDALWDHRTGVFAEPMCLFGGAITWRAGTSDDFIRAIAEWTEVGLIVELERGQVYAPYDGGADLFFATASERDLARERHQAWLSPRPDGL